MVDHEDLKGIQGGGGGGGGCMKGMYAWRNLAAGCICAGNKERYTRNSGVRDDRSQSDRWQGLSFGTVNSQLYVVVVVVLSKSRWCVENHNRGTVCKPYASLLTTLCRANICLKHLLFLLSFIPCIPFLRRVAFLSSIWVKGQLRRKFRTQISVEWQVQHLY